MASRWSISPIPAPNLSMVRSHCNCTLGGEAIWNSRIFGSETCRTVKRAMPLSRQSSRGFAQPIAGTVSDQRIAQRGMPRPYNGQFSRNHGVNVLNLIRAGNPYGKVTQQTVMQAVNQPVHRQRLAAAPCILHDRRMTYAVHLR